MSKKLLVVVGSERVGGNSDTLANAFLEGAREAGHECEKFVARNIHGCIGCDTCLAKEHWCSCVFKDAMNDLYPKYVACDGVVIASPIYDFYLSSQAKAFLDRLYACQFSPRRKKEGWLLLSAADLDEDVFDQTIAWFRHAMVTKSGWTERGVLGVRGVQHLGDVRAKTDAESQAREMGRNA